VSGGKGGSTTSQVEIPEWLEQASQRNIGRAEQAQQIGYMPYYGPDIAAFSPAQQTAMQSSYDAAAAFGLAPQGGDVMAGMPKAQDFGGGFMGYSSAPLYEQALAELQAKQPGQVEQYNRMFVDPATGAPAENFMRAQADQAAQAAQSGQMMGSGRDGRDPVTGEPVDYTGSQIGRDIGFGLYGMPFSPVSNLVGAAMLDNEIRAIDRTYDDLPTTRGGDNNGGGFADDSDPGGGSFGSPSGWD